MMSYRLRRTIVVPTIELTWKMSHQLNDEDGTRLRGFVGTYFLDDDLKHNHIGEGLRYSYPRVQYKIICGETKIIGLSKGVDSVRRLVGINKVTIARKEIDVIDRCVRECDSAFGARNQSSSYSFLTPWLALNKTNYEKYQRLGTWLKRKELLMKILVGNIISISKSLGYTVPGPIDAQLREMREVQTSLKDTPMLGFVGNFSVNFEIPDYWGIGKSVSRGFGTVKRIDK